MERAKLHNAGPLIYIILNHKSAYCVIFRSSKDFDTCKTGGPKWPCGEHERSVRVAPADIFDSLAQL